MVRKSSARKKKAGNEEPGKIFVIDTSVILYDSNAINNFDEHSIVIPIQVLEEVDNFKKGNETKNFEAREFIRFVDQVAQNQLINDWVPLNGAGKGKFKVALTHDVKGVDAVRVLGDKKYDNQILNCALSTQEANPDKKVILVSKDICLRLKAKALNIQAEDYETGKVKDVSKLYKGHQSIDRISETLLDSLFNKGFGDPELLPKKVKPVANEYFVLRNAKKSVLARYDALEQMLVRVKPEPAFGIKALNAEQSFALDALANPSIKLITIQGKAGTGKTLLALASAIEQRRDYRQIFVSRPVIPLSNKDIGYLPGDIKSKLDPYMQSIWDNLNYIKSQFRNTDKNVQRIKEMVDNEKIAISPLAYIRGRSLVKIFFIVDEAQNLTPHEVKTIISRAGDDTKIVFAGDIHQIDTPYLDSESNGLSYLIDKVKGSPLFAHIALEKGERSDLANLANEHL
ncbi:MAG: PhoH family protein [Cryomorphaceae bacterium]|nr:MAG: PhoH family protein [Cryomorphaceae bacterium]